MPQSEVSSGRCVTNKVWEFLNAVLMMRVWPLEIGVQAQVSNHLYVAGLKRFGEKR